MKFLYLKAKAFYNYTISFFIKAYLWVCIKILRKSKRQNTDENCDVVVSLTSYYKRFPTLKWTLQSLLQQKTKYKYRLIVVLSEEDIEKYGRRPEYLKEFEERGLEVLVVKENLKSYKKAFYTYDLGLPLITTDDDVYYPSWWLEKLMKESENTPNTVLAYRGHYIMKDNEEDDFLPYIEWMKWSTKNFILEATYSLLPTGTSGIYYPVGALNGLKESKPKFLEICPHADDLWFRYISVVNGFKARRILKKNIHFTLMSEGESLFDVNVGAGENDIQFKRILNYGKKFKERICFDASSIL